MMRFLLQIVLVLFLLPLPAQALVADEVVVIANSSFDGSVELARYYMKKRGIPEGNLVRIKTTRKEFCSRRVYDEEIAKPVRDFLEKRKETTPVRCLVTMRGVPLRINPHAWDKQGAKQIKKLQKEREAVQKRLSEITEDQKAKSESLKLRVDALDRQLEKLKKKNDRAAVDSELTLVQRDSYPIINWIANPYFAGFQGRKLPVPKKDVLFVARLDAPSEKIVRRMIDDSIAIEAVGLNGTVYIDARWPKSDKVKRSDYGLYDNYLHSAADNISSKLKLPVVLNDKAELFQDGEAPDAALYCGWYSVNRYVDAFDWKTGAVGYHIASSECATLRSGSAKGWCKMMLEDGITATVGPVGEPYLQAFPPPDIFFNFLIDGYYSLAEVYFLSTPFLSWQMVLIGDPLYRPFAKNPAEKRKSSAK